MKICKRIPIFLTILVALISAQSGRAAERAPAQTAFDRSAGSIAPAERFEVDGVLVERHGSPGSAARPLILIPGLASGGWVWQGAVHAFAAERPLYVLTLPGFDGRPPANANAFADATAAVEKLIAQRQLARPVIVGHSLGAALAFAVAENQPGLVGGVIAIDGLPVMPGTESLSAAERSRYAQAMKARLGAQQPAAFAAQQLSYMRNVGVIDAGQADQLARLTGRSDPASTGQYAADVLALDLRPGLRAIVAPVLVISPYAEADGARQGLTAQAKAGYYRSLLQGAPKVEVVTVSPARHFAMFDAPQQVNDAIRNFLGGL